jgi:hypothetical protein
MKYFEIQLKYTNDDLAELICQKTTFEINEENIELYCKFINQYYFNNLDELEQ